jgi:hypothetical protein
MDAVCRSCYAELVPGDAFCAQCGSALGPVLVGSAGTFQDGGSTTDTVEQEAPPFPVPKMAETTAPQEQRGEGLATRAIVIGSLVLALAAAGAAVAVRGSSSPVHQSAVAAFATATDSATAASTPTATDSATATSTPTATDSATVSATAVPFPAVSATAVATQVDELILRSGAARALLTKGVIDAAGCGVSGAGEINAALQQRQSLLIQLQVLDLTALPRGAQVKAALAQTMEQSIVADQFFLSWAEEPVVSGCTGKAIRDSVLLQANAASAESTAVKQQFIALWNPIALQLGLPARAEPDL